MSPIPFDQIRWSKSSQLDIFQLLGDLIGLKYNSNLIYFLKERKGFILYLGFIVFWHDCWE